MGVLFSGQGREKMVIRSAFMRVARAVWTSGGRVVVVLVADTGGVVVGGVLAPFMLS